jgi:hypothetical protein
VKKRRLLNADRSPLTTRRLALWPLFAVVDLFVVSRVDYCVAGVRSDATTLPWFWQFIDPALVQRRVDAFVANALEIGENNRFRFVTDALVFAFLAAWRPTGCDGETGIHRE